MRKKQQNALQQPKTSACFCTFKKSTDGTAQLPKHDLSVKYSHSQNDQDAHPYLTQHKSARTLNFNWPAPLHMPTHASLARLSPDRETTTSSMGVSVCSLACEISTLTDTSSPQRPM